MYKIKNVCLRAFPHWSGTSGTGGALRLPARGRGHNAAAPGRGGRGGTCAGGGRAAHAADGGKFGFLFLFIFLLIFFYWVFFLVWVSPKLKKFEFWRNLVFSRNFLFLFLWKKSIWVTDDPGFRLKKIDQSRDPPWRPKIDLSVGNNFFIL